MGKLRKKKPQQQEALFSYSVHRRKQISQFSATFDIAFQKEFVALSQCRPIALLPDGEVLESFTVLGIDFVAAAFTVVTQWSLDGKPAESNRFNGEESSALATIDAQSREEVVL